MSISQLPQLCLHPDRSGQCFRVDVIISTPFPSLSEDFFEGMQYVETREMIAVLVDELGARGGRGVTIARSVDKDRSRDHKREDVDDLSRASDFKAGDENTCVLGVQGVAEHLTAKRCDGSWGIQGTESSESLKGRLNFSPSVTGASTKRQPTRITTRIVDILKVERILTHRNEL